MTKELFMNELETKLNLAISDEYEVVRKTVVKDDGEKNAIYCAKKGEGKVAPLFYEDNLFEIYNDGNSIEEIIEHIMSESMSIANSNSYLNDITEKLTNKEFVLDNVLAVLVGQSAKERIEKDNLVYEPFHDMFIVYEIPVEVYGKTGTIRITKQIVECCGATEEEVLLIGKVNSREKCGYQFTDLGNILGFGYNSGQFMLSNKDCFKGAYSLLCADLKSKADELGANLVLLPSSIHEWIVVPDDGRPVDEYKFMVKQVNDNGVAENERLSYNVYYYDRENGTLGEMK